MNRRHILLTILVFTLVISASIQPAIAYFTSYATAKGSVEINLGDTTEISETFDPKTLTKTIVISSEENSEPVYIRAKVIYTGLDGQNAFTASGEGWTALQDDGYYYYGSTKDDLTILKGDEETTELKVTITSVPDNPEDGTSFSVTVIYESTPVRYNADHPTGYALWNKEWTEKIVLDQGDNNSEEPEGGEG